MEDAKIIALFWERNEQAVKETDTAYGGKLYSLSNRILNNREDAEESVSDLDSIQTISEVSGFSQSKVTSMLHRLRGKLRKKLSEEGYV